MKLSIVLATLNESDLPNTIQSIRDTAGDKPECIIVDDCSSMPVQSPHAKVIHNPMRCGVGPSRHIGALAASGEYLLITDAHVRFEAGWYEEALRRIEGRPRTLHCAHCIGWNSKVSMADSTQHFFGGTLNVFGPDRSGNGKMQVMETIWGPKDRPDDAEIPCCMGACYFIPRDWFLHLGALRFLRYWGEDETMLSVKCWLAGGDVRYFDKVRIGHRFLLPGERQRFGVPVGWPTYNKLFAIHTLLERDRDIGTKLCILLEKHTEKKEWVAAYAFLRENYYLVEQEQAYNHTIFKHDFRWLCGKFGLPCPA